jgi:putative spermidine/putrescine transport system substrate-binding protein
MIHRRTLLLGTAGLTLASLLTSCGGVAANALTISLLEGSVPPEVLKQFRQQASEPVEFQLATQMKSLFQQLQVWQKAAQEAATTQPEPSRWRLPSRNNRSTATPNHLVSLGDYWLTSAIAQDLLAPLEIPEQTLEKLPVTWQQFVRRDKNGQLMATDSSAAALWAAPYNVQALVIVYRQSQFSQDRPFASWQDLLQPQLERRLALPEHPRLVIGLLQKMRSGSFNSSFESLNQPLRRSQLAQPFAQLNQQVKVYDSSTSLKALINEDIDAAITWSGDVAQALDRYRDLKVAIPQEGSLLSADLWVRPKGAQMSAAAQSWIDFCWQAGPATQISTASQGLSPVFLGGATDLPSALNGSLLSAAAVQKSEPMLPLPEATQAAYLSLWEELRTAS